MLSQYTLPENRSAGEGVDMMRSFGHSALRMTGVVFCLVVTCHINHALSATKPITLKDAIKIAFQKNLDIKIAELDRDLGTAAIDDAEAAFDTNLSTSADWKHDEDKPVSTLSGSRNITENVNFGVIKKIVTGTTLDLQFKNVYKETNSTSSTLKEYWDPRLELNVTQPIFENFFGMNDRKNLTIGDLKNLVHRHNAEDKIESALVSVAKSYLDFLAAEDILEIDQKALEDAKKLLSANQKKLKLGTIEETDLLASEANVLSRENDVSLSKNNWNDRHEKVKIALQEELATILNPKDSLSFHEESFALKNAMHLALQNKKEYLSGKKDLESKDLKQKVTSNQKFPEMDLVGTIAYNGLDKRYDQAVDDVFGFLYPTYFAGFTFKFPLENNSAQSKNTDARVQKLQALFKVKKIENEIYLDIAQKINALETYANQVKTTQKINDILLKKAKSEDKKFNQGRSSINFVIQFQEDYLKSSLNYVQSLLDYEKAVIDMKKAQGTLLNEYMELSL